MYQWFMELEAAMSIAKKAGQLALKYWNQGIIAERKPDASPVTVADREAEREIARGQADLWIEISGQPWDFAPLKVIAEEAGARFFNFDGGSSIYAGNCVMCAPGMEKLAREFIASR